MPLPPINFQYVDFLVSKANEKIAKFDQKVEAITRKLRELEDELGMVTAFVEYLTLHDKRAELIGMFWEQGEYGTAAEEHPDSLDILKRRQQCIEGMIPFYQSQLKLRQDHIVFMKNDLTLLEKIGRLSSLSRYRDAVNISL